MNILKKLFGATSPSPPSHRTEVFVKWDNSGKEYGPYALGDLLHRSWSGPPKVAKIAGEKKWKDYSRVFKLLATIPPSEEQISKLKKLKIDASADSYHQAASLIIDAQKKKRESNDRLPATKATLKKLEENGIKAESDITRKEAKVLLKKHQNNQRKDQLLKLVKARGIELSDRVTLSELEEVEYSEAPNDSSLSELRSICKKLDSLKVKYKLPKIITQESLEDTIDIFEEATSEAESAVDDVKMGFISTDKSDYEINGIPADADFRVFMADICQRVLKETWDAEKNLKAMIKKHFPTSSFERIE